MTGDADLRESNPFAFVFTRQAILILLTISLVSFLLLILLPRATIFGVRTRIFMGESMEPTLQSGSLVFDRQADPNTLAVGDMISFRQRGSEYATIHRIVGRTQIAGQIWFTTKGDANPVNDTQMVGPEVQVHTPLVVIPHLGYLLMVTGPVLTASPLFILGGTALHSRVRRWLPASIRTGR
jgi:signal peptidase